MTHLTKRADKREEPAATAIAAGDYEKNCLNVVMNKFG